MASEKSSGGRKGRASSPRGKSSGGRKKSGWVKPDGTPLRRRKGEYFPDSEIEKRKPAQRSKTGAPRPFSRDRKSDDSNHERVSRPYNKGSEDFSRKPASGNERSYDKSPSDRDERSGDFKSKSERPIREDRPARSDRKDSYRDYKSRASRSGDDRPTRSNKEDRAERPSRDDRTTRSREDRAERPLRDDRTTRSREDRAERPSREDRPTRSNKEDRTERPSRDDRPTRSREDRAERPSREDRPTRSSDVRSERPSRDDRPTRSREDRVERPSRDDRQVSSDREHSSESPRRDYGSKDSGKKPFEKKRERYADRDHSKEMRGRFDKKNTKGGFEKRAPKSRSSFSGRSASEKSEGVRLNKFIANAGICSRREADDLITAGVISVNGEIVTELGTKVLPTDEVKFHEQTLRTEKMVYVLLNKPKDYITTTDDPEERKTVMNLVHDAGKERIFPVGRLDRNTTGLLLITNDGELTKRLTHPSGNIKKIYQVELDRNLTQDDMVRAAEGVELEDGPASVDEIHYESPSEKNIIGVELHSGRNRVVRRIFEAMDYKVKKLDRVYFAGLTKKDLPRGRWRFLTELEVNMLKMQTGKKRG